MVGLWFLTQLFSEVEAHLIAPTFYGRVMGLHAARTHHTANHQTQIRYP
jgi:hypothetical protein